MANNPVSRRLDQSIVDAMEACLAHARGLILSAKAVRSAGQPNVAYHLATLALEEIGKRELFGVQAVADMRQDAPTWPGKQSQDHVKKLFWALFGAEFTNGKLTKEKLDEIKGLATTIHANRLEGLYVDLNEDGLNVPAEAIGDAQADTLIGLAEARLGIAEAVTIRQEISAEDAALQAWFLKSTEDREQRRQILSSVSLDKLAELTDSKKWILWLKGLYDTAEAEGRAAAIRELERSRNLPAEGTKDKWRIRVRILSASHSIRPKALKVWNDHVELIKLVAVSGKKDQLIMELTLKDNVPIEALWYFGWGLARHFVVALNMGTMGFWWWRLPEQVDRYWDSITDLENGQEIGVERSPSLKIDWGENRALTEEDMYRVMTCFSALPRPEQRDQHVAYNHYIGGLTFLSLNDIHWQNEPTAFGNFILSLQAMMKDAGDFKEGTKFTATFLAFLDAMFPGFDERERYAELCHQFEAGQLGRATVTLKEVSFIKLFCDAYFMRTIRPRALDSLKAEAECGAERMSEPVGQEPA
jgi:AbiV family abortive infection protein